MAGISTLTSAAVLASRNTARFPNESPEYRGARNALLEEEIELRRHLWRVAEQRRALPPGGEVKREYRFDGKDGSITLDGLFGSRDTLVVYSFMYGPQRQQGCPMCSATMSAWDGEAPHIEQRVAFAMIARSPFDRIEKFARQRGWKNLKLYSDPSGDYTQDYVGDRDADTPGFNVFTRRDGVIRHFYAAEGSPEMADPGQDPHAAPDFNPLWILLDLTPEGRGTDWYPSLDYED